MKLLLSIENLCLGYPASGLRPFGRAVEPTRAVLANVSLRIHEGESVGVIGASGAGKSSLARCIIQAPPPTSGAVKYLGEDLAALRGRALRLARRGIQMIFQDPISSLNPNWSVRRIVGEPLQRVAGFRSARRHSLVDRSLLDVGLDPDEFQQRLPHQLSGGQCQRVAIARAIVDPPRLIICDEAVSSLDMAGQAAILGLLQRLCTVRNIALLYISHDILVLRRLCHRIVVLGEGTICEDSDAMSILDRPSHPETKRLVAAARMMAASMGDDSAPHELREKNCYAAQP